MGPVENSVIARGNLDQMHLRAMELGGGGNEKRAVLVDSKGQMRTGAPARTLPGLWTRFKAAFIGFPGIGRLASVRDAHAFVQAVQFRSDFRLAVERRFGAHVADKVLPMPVPAGKKTTLSAKKVVRVMGEAQREGIKIGLANSAVIRVAAGGANPIPRELVISRHARMLGISRHADFFQKNLTSAQANQLIGEARFLRADTLPPTFEAILNSFEQRLDRAPVAEKREIAKSYLDALQNLDAILAAGEAGEGSSNGAAARRLSELDVTIVSQFCALAAGPDAKHYSPEIVRQAWADLHDAYDKLHREVPDLPAEALSRAFAGVMSGRASITPAALLTLAREKLVENEMKGYVRHLVDPNNAESPLRKAVQDATGATEFPAAMPTITREVLSEFEDRVPHLPLYLKCGDDLPTILERTAARLRENIVAATVGHIKAMQEVEASQTLTPAQKEVFRRYAEGVNGHRPQRLDPVQVQQFTAMGDALAKNEGTARDPMVLFDAMIEIQAVFTHGNQEIANHAGTMWVASNLDGPEPEQRRVELCADLMVAKKVGASGDTPQIQEGPPRLTHSVTLPSGSDAAIPQFMKACGQAATSQIAKVTQLFEDIMKALDLPMTEPGNYANATHPELAGLPPELLVRTLSYPPGQAETGSFLDERGVLIDSPAGAIVAHAFQPGNVVNLDRHELKLEEAMLREINEMPKALDGALKHGDVIVKGEHLKADPTDENQLAFDTYEAFLGTLAPPVGDAITCCLASDALQNFVNDANAAAFSTPVTSTPPRISHEVWQDKDGNWLVRSTQVTTPMAQGGRPIQTDGVVLHTLTHKIVPAEGGGNPHVSLVDSNVVFAF